MSDHELTPDSITKTLVRETWVVELTYKTGNKFTTDKFYKYNDALTEYKHHRDRLMTGHLSSLMRVELFKMATTIESVAYEQINKAGDHAKIKVP